MLVRCVVDTRALLVRCHEHPPPAGGAKAFVVPVRGSRPEPPPEAGAARRPRPRGHLHRSPSRCHPSSRPRAVLSQRDTADPSLRLTHSVSQRSPLQCARPLRGDEREKNIETRLLFPLPVLIAPFHAHSGVFSCFRAVPQFELLFYHYSRSNKKTSTAWLRQP